MDECFGVLLGAKPGRGRGIEVGGEDLDLGKDLFQEGLVLIAKAPDELGFDDLLAGNPGAGGFLDGLVERGLVQVIGEQFLKGDACACGWVGLERCPFVLREGDGCGGGEHECRKKSSGHDSGYVPRGGGSVEMIVEEWLNRAISGLLACRGSGVFQGGLNH